MYHLPAMEALSSLNVPDLGRGFSAFSAFSFSSSSSRRLRKLAQTFGKRCLDMRMYRSRMPRACTSSLEAFCRSSIGTPVLSSPEMDTRWKYGVKASAAEDAAADAVTPAAE